MMYYKAWNSTYRHDTETLEPQMCPRIKMQKCGGKSDPRQTSNLEEVGGPEWVVCGGD